MTGDERSDTMCRVGVSERAHPHIAPTPASASLWPTLPTKRGRDRKSDRLTRSQNARDLPPHAGRGGDPALPTAVGGSNPYPHHILHIYQASTASAWPPPPDMVSRQRRFGSPHVTGRNAPNRLRRWRYFADELFQQRQDHFRPRLVLYRRA